MLEFTKNLLHHCNDKCREKEKLLFYELEEAITSTFSELPLLIFNYCLMNKNVVKDLIPYDIIEDNNDKNYRLCDGCGQCYTDLGLWETVRNSRPRVVIGGRRNQQREKGKPERGKGESAMG